MPKQNKTYTANDLADIHASFKNDLNLLHTAIIDIQSRISTLKRTVTTANPQLDMHFLTLGRILDIYEQFTEVRCDHYQDLENKYDNEDAVQQGSK